MNSEDVCGTKNTNSEDVSTKVAGKKSRHVKNEITHNSRQNSKLPPKLKTPAKTQNSRQKLFFPPKIKNCQFLIFQDIVFIKKIRKYSN